MVVDKELRERVRELDQIVGQHGDQLNAIESTLYPKIEDQGKPLVNVQQIQASMLDEFRQINNWLQQINENLKGLNYSIQNRPPFK